MEREDLDGQRLSDGAESWLIFHGERHRISPAAADALFAQPRSARRSPEVHALPRGEDVLRAGLVRQEGSLDTYLVSERAAGFIVRMLIPNAETFEDFGFAAEKVATAPALVIEGLAQGRPILSPRGRAAGRRAG